MSKTAKILLIIAIVAVIAVTVFLIVKKKKASAAAGDPAAQLKGAPSLNDTLNEISANVPKVGKPSIPECESGNYSTGNKSQEITDLNYWLLAKMVSKYPHLSSLADRTKAYTGSEKTELIIYNLGKQTRDADGRTTFTVWTRQALNDVSGATAINKCEASEIVKS